VGWSHKVFGTSRTAVANLLDETVEMIWRYVAPDQTDAQDGQQRTFALPQGSRLLSSAIRNATETEGRLARSERGRWNPFITRPRY
jgi:hypothetical protein